MLGEHLVRLHLCDSVGSFQYIISFYLASQRISRLLDKNTNYSYNSSIILLFSSDYVVVIDLRISTLQCIKHIEKSTGEDGIGIYIQ